MKNCMCMNLKKVCVFLCMYNFSMYHLKINQFTSLCYLCCCYTNFFFVLNLPFPSLLLAVPISCYNCTFYYLCSFTVDEHFGSSFFNPSL